MMSDLYSGTECNQVSTFFFSEILYTTARSRGLSHCPSTHIRQEPPSLGIHVEIQVKDPLEKTCIDAAEYGLVVVKQGVVTVQDRELRAGGPEYALTHLSTNPGPGSSTLAVSLRVVRGDPKKKSEPSQAAVCSSSAANLVLSSCFNAFNSDAVFVELQPDTMDAGRIKSLTGTIVQHYTQLPHMGNNLSHLILRCLHFRHTVMDFEILKRLGLFSIVLSSTNSAKALRHTLGVKRCIV